MLTYPGNIKDYYTLAKVVKIYPDSKGLVRKVRVKYREKKTLVSPEMFVKPVLLKKM